MRKGRLQAFYCVGSLQLVSGIAALGTVTPVYQSNSTSVSFYDAKIPIAAANNDLILANSSTLGSATYSGPASLYPTFANVGFHDGSVQGNINMDYQAILDPTGTPNLPDTYTFNLTGSATGYDINSIQSVAGWTDDIADQDFQVYVKTVSNPTFTQVGGSFLNAPFNQTNTASTTPTSTLTTITDTTGKLASGVTAIQFKLLNGGFNQTGNGSYQGTVYRDVAVDGTPTGGGPMPAPTPTYMPLGDSITDGRSGNLGGLDDPGGYRDHLYTLMTNAGRKLQFVGSSQVDPTNQLINTAEASHSGYSGYRIDQLITGASGSPTISQMLTQAPANNVLLLIGTNDILQEYDPTPTAPGDFEQHMVNRLDTLITDIYTSDPGSKIYLSSIIPILTTANDSYSARNPSVNLQVIEYNSLLQSEVIPYFKSLGDKISFVDNYNALTADPNYATDYYPYSNDDVHPNDAGYTVMAQAWYNAITTVPEPSALGLIGVSTVGLLRRRARCRANRI